MNKIQLLFLKLGARGHLDWLPDSLYLGIIYRIRTGKKLHLRNPVTFNEKMQWLKIYCKDMLCAEYVDKYSVRGYIAELIGSEYLIPVLEGPWDSADEIPFERLPNQFVLKCTHDSGGVFVCKDKAHADISVIRERIKERLSRNYYSRCREWPYKDVKPRVYAEKYMEDASGELRDYKFFCFNGKVKCMKVDFDRFVGHRANYYDSQMKLLPFGEAICPPDFSKQIEKPEQYDKMVALAEKLSARFKFLRVDFYCVGGKIYFGELTFFPASGLGRFTPEEWDETLGSWLNLED